MYYIIVMMNDKWYDLSSKFYLMAAEPERDYGQKKNAKYQDQTGITLPRMS